MMQGAKSPPGAVIMNTISVSGSIGHLDLNPSEVGEFADLFYRAALQIQMSGYSDGRTVGVVQEAAQGQPIWYPSVSVRLLDEVVTYSLTLENAAALAAEMERRAAASALSGCVASASFFRFFASELPGMIRFAERQNMSGASLDASSKRGSINLAATPAAGLA